MSKKRNKKRNKRYQGENAVPDQPVIHRYEAVKKSKTREFLEENKLRIIRNTVILAALLIAYTIIS